MRVAIVQDFLNQRGGAERCLETLRDLFPEATLFTLVHDPVLLPDAHVRTSFVQRLPFAVTHHYVYLPLYPYAIGRFDFSGFDLIVSSSAAFSKNLRTPPGALHVCLCYTPMRFVHVMPSTYLDRVPGWARPATRLLLSRLRTWDVDGAAGVDRFIAISEVVRDRIRRCYGRESTVIYPPVDVNFFTPGGHAADVYLTVSRLVPQKRVDLAIEAFQDLDRPLHVVGTGPDEKRLRRMAGPNVVFHGRTTDEHLRDLYRRCRGLVHAGEDEFGIAPVEAQACGKPVIALAAGGALETIEEGRTGCLFTDPTPVALADAVRRTDAIDFDPATIRERALRFSPERFRREVATFISAALDERMAAAGARAGREVAVDAVPREHL